MLGMERLKELMIRVISFYELQLFGLSKREERMKGAKGEAKDIKPVNLKTFPKIIL